LKLAETVLGAPIASWRQGLAPRCGILLVSSSRLSISTKNQKKSRTIFHKKDFDTPVLFKKSASSQNEWDKLNSICPWTGH
jgi:hypothetical protein